MACAQQGDAAGAWQLFEALSPAHRSAHPTRGQTYGLEPYVMAGDIYSHAPYAGRGGWSWYTGAASWLQRAAIESICGLQWHGDHIRLQPCLPPHWPGLTLRLQHAGRSLLVVLLRQGEALPEHLPLPLPTGQVRVVEAGEAVDLNDVPEGTQLLLRVQPAASLHAGGAAKG